MIKRIVAGTVLAALAAVLVLGAINRTNAKSVENAGGVGSGRLASAGQVSASGGGSYRWNQDAGNLATNGGRGRQGDAESTTGTGRGVGSNQDVTTPGDGLAAVGEWVTVTGAVVSVGADKLVVRLADGTVLEVTDRAWSFAQSLRFVAAAGDHLTLVGFYENGDFEVGHLGNDTTGVQVALRDSTGRPLWAGNGRGRTS